MSARLNPARSRQQTGQVLALLIAVLLPTGVGYGAVVIARALRWRARRRPPLPPAPMAEITADLRRLHAQVEQLEAAPRRPAKHLHVTAARAAYVDALVAACARMGVPPPAEVRGSVPQAEIYRVEHALRRAGIDVRHDVPA